MQIKNVLRIGVLLGDNLVEERLLRKREAVSIGQSNRNTFVVPIDGMPKTFPVFELRGEKYYLNFTAKHRGRLTVNSKVRTLESLRDREAKRNGDIYSIELENGARGRVEFGEMRLLFQLVAAPPKRPAPRLPASIRGSLADRIDPRLSVVLAVSILLHFGVGFAAYNHDKTLERPAERLQREFRADIMQPPPPPIEVTAPSATGNAATSKAVASKETRTGTSETVSSSSRDEGAPSDLELEETFRNQALMSVLGAESGPGRYQKGSDIDQGAGLQAGIDDIRANSKEVRTETDDRPRESKDGETIARDKSDGGIDEAEGSKEAGPVVEHKIESREELLPIDDVDGTGTLKPELVFRKIKTRYIRGIKRCHEIGLKPNPKLKGKLKLGFTVGPTGRLTKRTARGVDPQVDKCVQSYMSRWRFSAPKDEDGGPASASFSLGVMLKPSR